MSALVNLFYIYDPWLFHFLRMAFVMGIFASGLFLYKWYKKEPLNIVIPLDSVAVILGLIGLSAISLLINGTKDFSVVLMYIKSLILFGFGVLIYSLFYAQNNQQKLVKDLQIGISIQSLVGFLALAGIPFMVDLALSTNANLPRFFGSEQEYRLYNITSSAFFQLSAFYLLLLHFILAYNEKHNNISSLFLFLILFIGAVSGRTFFMLSLVSIALYFKWRYIPALVAFVAVVLILAIYFPENHYVAHALEPVINLISGAGQVSSSTDTLVKKHLFMPELKQLLIGDGYYYTETKSYYGGSDSGFIRQALYGGVGYILTCFLFMFYFVRKVAINWFNYSWKFILSTLFIFSVLNVKADTYAFPGIMLVLLMFLSLFGTSGWNLEIFSQKREKNV
ncbi:hypothetical protein B0187_09625 [Haemophilus paracuniculus]|uniref:Uncharacterized protein n=1 Tax=Haemophilus paracuniculus TaxID=734 RepID=A0A1T0AQ26_9PAST|nr:hypothetical protein [Haemophilus paracuniculus]OOR98190.1 hypothetical protein B0187_09625 [Haemophilus paracuniculus]